jgi:predicted peroxiredoxin
MEQKKFVFILTHSFDRPDMAAGALQIAANMKAFDIIVDFFLINEGVLIARKGFAEEISGQKKDGFLPVHELLHTLVEDFEVNFYVCASCVKPYGLKDAEMISRASIKPGSFLAEMLLERQCLTF